MTTPRTKAGAPAGADPATDEKISKKAASRGDAVPVVATAQKKAPPMPSSDPSVKNPVVPRKAARAEALPAEIDRAPRAADEENQLRDFLQKIGVSAREGETDSEAIPKHLATFGPDDPLVGAAQKAGESLKSLATWSAGATPGEESASVTAPLFSSLKKLASWGLSDEPSAKPRAASDEDPLVGFARQTGTFLKNFTKVDPDDSVAGFARQTGTYFKDTGDYLKGLATTWQFPESVGAAGAAQPGETTMRRFGTLGPQDPLVALARNAGTWLKGLATWRVTEAGHDDAGPDSVLGAFKKLASIGLDEKPGAVRTRPVFDDILGEAAQKTGVLLKSLATWKVVERKGDAAPDPFWTYVKNVAAWRFDDAKGVMEQAGYVKLNSSLDVKPAYDFDKLQRALTRVDADRREA